MFRVRFKMSFFTPFASALRNSGDSKGARPDGTNVESGPTVQGAVKRV